MNTLYKYNNVTTGICTRHSSPTNLHPFVHGLPNNISSFKVNLGVAVNPVDFG